MFTPTSKDNGMNDLKTASNAIQTGASEAKGDLRIAANKAGHTVRQYFDAACDEITRDSEMVTTEIRRNPVQSSMIALGLGFVLGSLLRR